MLSAGAGMGCTILNRLDVQLELHLTPKTTSSWDRTEFDWKLDIRLDSKALDQKAVDGARHFDAQLGELDSN